MMELKYITNIIVGPQVGEAVSTELLNEQCHEAIGQHDIKMVKKYLGMGAEVAAKNSDGRAAIHLAILHGHTDILKLLVEVYAANVNAIDGEGNSCLVYACIRDDVDVCKLLMDNGASTEHRNLYGETLYHYCGRFNSKNVCKLLAKETRLDVNARDYIELRTALHVACANALPSYEVVDTLCTRTGMKVNAIDGHGESALFNLCRLDTNTEIIRCLIRHGCDINLSNARSISPLREASRHYAFKNVAVLLAQPGIIIDWPHPLHPVRPKLIEYNRPLYYPRI